MSDTKSPPVAAAALLEADAPRGFFLWLVAAGKAERTAQLYKSAVKMILQQMVRAEHYEYGLEIKSRLAGSTAAIADTVWPHFIRFCGLAAAAAAARPDAPPPSTEQVFLSVAREARPAQLAGLNAGDKATGARIPKVRLPYPVLWAASCLIFGRQGRDGAPGGKYFVKRDFADDKKGWYTDEHIASVRWLDVKWRNKKDCRPFDRQIIDEFIQIQTGYAPEQWIKMHATRFEVMVRGLAEGKIPLYGEAGYGNYFAPGVVIFVRDCPIHRREPAGDRELETLTLNCWHARYLSEEQMERAVGILWDWGGWELADVKRNAPLIPVEPRSFKPIPAKALTRLLDEYDPQLDPMPSMDDLYTDMREMGYGMPGRVTGEAER